MDSRGAASDGHLLPTSLGADTPERVENVMMVERASPDGPPEHSGEMAVGNPTPGGEGLPRIVILSPESLPGSDARRESTSPTSNTAPRVPLKPSLKRGTTGGGTTTETTRPLSLPRVQIQLEPISLNHVKPSDSGDEDGLAVPGSALAVESHVDHLYRFSQLPGFRPFVSTLAEPPPPGLRVPPPSSSSSNLSPPRTSLRQFETSTFRPFISTLRSNVESVPPEPSTIFRPHVSTLRSNIGPIVPDRSSGTGVVATSNPNSPTSPSTLLVEWEDILPRSSHKARPRRPTSSPSLAAAGKRPISSTSGTTLARSSRADSTNIPVETSPQVPISITTEASHQHSEVRPSSSPHTSPSQSRQPRRSSSFLGVGIGRLSALRTMFASSSTSRRSTRSSSLAPITPSDLHGKIPTSLWLSCLYTVMGSYLMSPPFQLAINTSNMLFFTFLLYSDSTTLNVSSSSIATVAIFAFATQLLAMQSGNVLARFHRVKGRLHPVAPAGRMLRSIQEALSLPNYNTNVSHLPSDTACGCRKCTTASLRSAGTFFLAMTVVTTILYVLASVFAILRGFQVDTTTWTRTLRIVFVLWHPLITFSSPTALVLTSRLASAFVLLGKVKWEQRMFREAFENMLRVVANDPSNPPLPDTTGMEYWNIHLTLLSIHEQEKSHFESVARVNAFLNLQHFLIVIVQSIASECASGYWIIALVVVLVLLLSQIYVVAVFNSSVVDTSRLIRETERALCAISLSLVLRRKELFTKLESLGDAMSLEVSGSGSRSDGVRQQFEEEWPKESNFEIPLWNENPEKFRTRSKADENPGWLAESYPRSIRLTGAKVGSDSSKAGSEVSSLRLEISRAEQRIQEAHNHQRLLSQLQNSEDHIIRFLGAPLTFETGRGISSVVLTGLFIAYQLFRANG
ncbi:hypothetical protein M427DRAFT_68823, partial [Gonapodya prolifera JEL478]